MKFAMIIASLLFVGSAFAQPANTPPAGDSANTMNAPAATETTMEKKETKKVKKTHKKHHAKSGSDTNM